MKTVSTSTKLTRVVLLLIFVITMVLLSYQGRLRIAASGDIFFRVSDAWSNQNSQHFSDPYSFSHLIHGLFFFGALYPFRKKIGLWWRLNIAMLLEAIREVFENSAFIINRYRDAGALGYSGDTILNATGDLIFCLLGFFLARYLGLWKTVMLFIVIELVLLRLIRDNLTLNVIQLIHPIDAIKEWQSVML